MVPRLAAQGASFEGAFLYYFHDKNALTTARIAWTETINMLSQKVEKAWKVMAYTAKHQSELKEASGQKRSGAKMKKAVLAYSLSWHPEQKPDRETMMKAAFSSLEELGLSEHEAMVACHCDEPQPHIHLVVNKAHPRTGLVADLKYTKRKLSDWARKFQKTEGTVYCPRREENYQKRKKGMKTQYGDPAMIDAWNSSQRGDDFKRQLEIRGYDLARGRKRLVVVDPHGKAVNPVRMLAGVTAGEFHERVADIDPQALPSPEEVLQTRTKTKPIAPSKPEKNEESQAEKDNAERLHEKRMAAFDARVLAATERLAEKHNQQWEKAKAQSQESIETKRRDLQEKLKLDQRQKAIAALQQKLKERTLIPKFARRLLGLDKKTVQKIETLRSTQQQARMRFDDELRRHEQNQKSLIANLESRQAKEERELKKRLKKWLPKEKYLTSLPTHTHICRETPSLRR